MKVKTMFLKYVQQKGPEYDGQDVVKALSM